ncbi:MAG TPA: FAD-dependent oxidoreductase, partial [Alphaproteobacteria bacterium]|nr:FAD-dependent oxidoreductase [Alphaproteobacteria bacterium]
EQLAAAGKANGVAALHWLSGPEVQAREPALRAVAALASPLTGIIDSHAFMLSLQADIEAAGGTQGIGR